LDEQRLCRRAVQERSDWIEQQRRTLAAELEAASQQHAAASQHWEASRKQLAVLEQWLTELEAAIRSDDERLQEIDAARTRFSRQATAAKVEAAKSEQRLESLRAQMEQFREGSRERARAMAECGEQLEQTFRRRRQAEREMLRAATALAELYLGKEALAGAAVRQAARGEQLADERNAAMEELHLLRRELRRLEEEAHQRELAAGEIRHQRGAVAERLREDYGVDLEQLEQQAAEPPGDERDSVDEEIETLRRKINKIGPVNLDALDELDAMEARFAALSSQHRDLVEAKQALERIIQKINADSRKLFLETLEAIRDNFQVLYRKSFGGGKADIGLEEGVDILECGVEIIATPPGKPSFSNSLLSGGEKALTAVALLLAIFQFRPSPFCVLDEVDAPFDEANIERFIEVLKGFLGWTKFVIVTHSKKTMTAATTLYGVTMQESGVSKQVSVRFEDVSEDGHIRREAIDRELGREGAPGDERGAA
jgi:chromosome segregation protein